MKYKQVNISEDFIIAYVKEILQFMEGLQELENTTDFNFSTAYYIAYGNQILSAMNNGTNVRKQDISDLYLTTLTNYNRTNALLNNIEETTTDEKVKELIRKTRK